MAITARERRAIEQAVAKANGSRRIRLLSVQQVKEVIEGLEAEGDWVFRHGGGVPAAYHYRSWTTAVFAAVVGGEVRWEVKAITARVPRPGQINHHLKSIRHRSIKSGKRAELIRAWAADLDARPKVRPRNGLHRLDWATEGF